MQDSVAGMRHLQRAQTQRSTDVRKKRTREAVFAAVEALTADPAGKLTVSVIAARAGISRSSFYAHFSSLPDLAESLMVEAMEKTSRDMGSMLRESATPVTIRAAFARMRDHFVEHHDLYRTALTLPGSGRAYRRAATTLTAINIDYIRILPNVPEDVDIETVAAAIAWSHYGVYDSWLRGELSVSPDRLVDTLFELLPAWFRDPSSNNADGR